MARLYNVSEATVSRIVSQHRQLCDESSLMSLL
jgi:DNA-binding LacI/PurR family transcriptional regulator